MKAAANITRGVNGKRKIIKSEDEKSPQGTLLSKNDQGKMGSVHAPTFVPRETGCNPGPRGMNGRVLPPRRINTRKGGFVITARTRMGDRYAPVQFVM